MNGKKNSGNAHTKSLRKRILIAAINGIVVTLIVRFNYIIWDIAGPSILVIGPIFFAVNVVATLIWEKNQNDEIKSAGLIFLPPIIKGVIIGAITGVIAMRWDAYYGGFIGGIIGLLIGMSQLFKGALMRCE